MKQKALLKSPEGLFDERQTHVKHPSVIDLRLQEAVLTRLIILMAINSSQSGNHLLNRFEQDCDARGFHHMLDNIGILEGVSHIHRGRHQDDRHVLESVLL
jgi:hypothetical protein